MEEDETIETQYLRTYVKHEQSGKWFLVSSINRRDSTIYRFRMSETMVFEWDNETKKMGKIIDQFSGAPNSLFQHVLCVESLLQDGELDDEEE